MCPYLAQECLKHVRSLDEKLASGKYALDSPELKQGVEALRAVLSRPSPKVCEHRERMRATTTQRTQIQQRS